MPALHPLPSSYTPIQLPDISFRHVPESSPTVTRTVVVRLDRFPPGRASNNNAFTDDMVTSLVTAFDTLSADPRVKAVVFTSADPKNRVFCSGMDLDGATASQQQQQKKQQPQQQPKSLETQRAEFRDGGGAVSIAIYNCKKPVIAAMNGHAVGVGMTMSLPCTLRIVSASAKVGFVFSRRGINMEACSSFFLPKLIGAGKAMQLVATGAVYSPSDPPIRDLFAEVLPAEQVFPRALEYAEEMAAKTSPLAVQTMKEMIFRGPESPEEATLLESAVFFDLFRGRDSREGITSFLEKREPQFPATWEEDRPAHWPWADVKDVYSGTGGKWVKSKI